MQKEALTMLFREKIKSTRLISVISALLILFSIFGCSTSQSHQPRAVSDDQKLNVPSPVPFTISHPIATFSKEGPVYASSLSPSGQTIALGGSKKVVLSDIGQKTLQQTLMGGSGDIISLVFSPDGEILATGSYRTIELWLVPSGRRLATFSDQPGYVTALAFSPNGQFLVSGSVGEKSFITIWNVKEQRLKTSLTYETQYADRIQSLAFSRDGQQLAAVGLDRRIRMWKLDQGFSTRPPDRILNVEKMLPRVIAFSPDRKNLAVGTTEGQIVLYDLSKGEILRWLNRHRGGITSLAFKPDGKTLISSGKDETIVHWNIITGMAVKIERINEGLEPVEISEDGRFVVAHGAMETAIFSLTDKIGIPPVIAIRTPSENETTDQANIRLSGKVVDDRGVVKVSIQKNNVLWQRKNGTGVRDLRIRESRNRREIVFDETVPLREGENIIIVTALDVEGLIRSETIHVNFTPDPGKVWAAVIGISRYQHVEGLRYADADARAFYNYLVDVNQIPKNQVTLLLNEQATLQRVKDLLGVELRQNARKQDTVIIYYAGHGAPEADRGSQDGDGLEKYLLPYDADPNRLYSTAFPMAEFARIFPRLSAERVVMFQDTCFSGSSKSSGRTIQTALFRASLSENYLNRLTQGKGRIIISASEANEVSLERDDLGHGVFTYYLLEAFRFGDIDGDGMITTTEVFRYVSEKVPEATGQSQHPVKKGVERSEIVLGKVWTLE